VLNTRANVFLVGSTIREAFRLHGPTLSPHCVAHASRADSQACAFCPQVGFQQLSSHCWSWQLAEHVQYCAAGPVAAHWFMHASGSVDGTGAGVGGVLDDGAGGVVGALLGAGVLVSPLVAGLVFLLLLAGSFAVCALSLAFGSSKVLPGMVGAAHPTSAPTPTATVERTRTAASWLTDFILIPVLWLRVRGSVVT
jgi:hypothetical protein